MIQYLHFRILEFPLITVYNKQKEKQISGNTKIADIYKQQSIFFMFQSPIVVGIYLRNR